MYEPDERLLDKLQEEFGLHDLAIEDAQHAHQRPKIEAYGESLFVVMHTAQVVDSHIRFGETYAFLGQRYLVTVRHGASLSYAPARARVEREPELLALGPAFGLYAIIDSIVDNYLPIATEFRDELNKLEQDIFAETYRRDTIVKLYELKRELTQLRLAVAPLQDILSQLTRMHTELVPKEVRPYFRDVLDTRCASTNHRHHARDAHRGDERQPVTGDHRSGRGGQEARRLGGAAGRTHADHQLVRDEFPQHAELQGRYS